jgi:hypothetical protein
MKLLNVVIADIVNLCMVCIALVMMVYISCKVYMYTKMQDRVLMLVILFLDLTLICKPIMTETHYLAYLIFFSSRISLYLNHNPVEEFALTGKATYVEDHFNYCKPAIVMMMPVFFFQFAVLFNLCKW